jgi:hypothetical protein
MTATVRLFAQARTLLAQRCQLARTGILLRRISRRRCQYTDTTRQRWTVSAAAGHTGCGAIARTGCSCANTRELATDVEGARDGLVRLEAKALVWSHTTQPRSAHRAGLGADALMCERRHAQMRHEYLCRMKMK